jgi:hypothetical protein
MPGVVDPGMRVVFMDTYGIHGVLEAWQISIRALSDGATRGLSPPPPTCRDSDSRSRPAPAPRLGASATRHLDRDAGSGKGALVSPRHGCRFSTPSLEVARAARLSYAMAVANGAHPTRADSFPHAATSSLNIVIVSAPRYCSDPVTRMNSRLTPPPRSEHRWAASQQLSPSNAFHRRTPTTSHSSSAILRHVCMTRAPASSQAATHSPSSNATTSADALSPSHRCVASTSTAKARWCTLRTCART